MKMRLVADFVHDTDAPQFAAALRDPDWWADNIVSDRRRVEWEVDPAEHSDHPDPESMYFAHTLQAVGYFGSTQAAKAKLSAEFFEGRTPWGPAVCPVTH